MTRKMSDEREKEFEELAVFLEFYATNCSKIERSNEIHPSNILEKIVEKYGKSKALQGLKQAINDTIEDTQHLSFNQIADLDQILSSKSIVTLSSLRRRYWSKYNKIIARGKIKGETEYYLVQGLLSSADGSLSENEIELLINLASEFEKNT